MFAIKVLINLSDNAVYDYSNLRKDLLVSISFGIIISFFPLKLKMKLFEREK